jgi:hypothetical protein
VSVVLVMVAAASGCSFDEVSLERTRCPCAPGWVCDVTANECVREGARDAGDHDASDGAVERADAGGPDASSDAASDAGRAPSACDDALSDVVFCDGFEDGTLLDPWTETFGEPGGAVLETERTYRGAGALRASVSGAEARSAIVLRGPKATTEGDVYARAYYYLASGGPDPLRLTALLFAERGGESLGVGAQLADTFYVHVGPVPARYPSPAAPPVPRDRWFCVQFHVRVGAAGAVHLSVDGTEVFAMDPVATLPPGGLQDLIVGIEYSADTAGPATLYADEIAVDGAPIPCD